MFSDLNLEGKKFNRLTVLKRGKNYVSAKGKVYSGWICKCDCGIEKRIKGVKLTSNSTKSCGCLKNENLKHETGSKAVNWTGYEGIPGTLWLRITSGAEARKIKLTIDIKYVWDLLVKQEFKCALSGIKLILPRNNFELISGKSTLSLDRIDSNEGYVEGNVQWVHKDINYMKVDLKQEEFIKYCKLITENCLKNSIPLVEKS